MSEEWRPAPGFESFYAVSDLGQVKRTAKARGTRCGILKPGKYRSGHLFVVLSVGGKTRTVAVHRLVGEAFLGPLPPGQETRHRDGNPANCARTNLLYGTHSDNMQDMIRHGHCAKSRITHCPSGHEHTAANIKRIPSRPNARYCRECARRDDRDRMRRARKG